MVIFLEKSIINISLLIKSYIFSNFLMQLKEKDENKGEEKNSNDKKKYISIWLAIL
ncbi:MAG TPA: hypothetical protein VJ697_05900 [Nitrososphaeraceae archaeon]|nr:hypothetical protein [Nitrososphaeraceae archaeon]